MVTDFRWRAHYAPGVLHTVDIPDEPIQQLLVDAAARCPHHVAIRMVLRYLPLGLKVQASLTFRELDRLSDRFAAALAQLGIGKGSRVAIMLPNIPQQVIAYFGVLKAGASVVNTNPTYPAHELAPLLANVGAEAIVTLSGLYARVCEIQPATALRQIILADIPDYISPLFRGSVARQVTAAGLMKPVTPGPNTYFFKALLAQAPPKPPAVSIDPAGDTAIFQFTGGTSGLPKAAELTHRNIVANVTQTAAWVPTLRRDQEKFLLALPAFHVYGMTVGMLCCLKLGGELILAPDPRNTQHILKMIAHEKVTLYPGVPAMYVAMLNHPDAGRYNLRSLRVCLSGGAPLPAELARRFEAATGGKLVEGYGMSESSPLAAGNPVSGRTKIGSIGLPFPSTEMAIQALEPAAGDGRPSLGVGEAGELLVRGPQVMKGYHNNPNETRAAIDADGWLHTGDIATMDEEGYFYIVDRKKDLIIASGYNIYPREVEEVLFMHPCVMEAAVAGVPDPKRGETVKAFVVLTPGQTATADEIRDFCRERLAPYKVPSLVEFRNDLPKSQAGKTLRRILVQESGQEASTRTGNPAPEMNAEKKEA